MALECGTRLCALHRHGVMAIRADGDAPDRISRVIVDGLPLLCRAAVRQPAAVDARSIQPSILPRGVMGAFGCAGLRRQEYQKGPGKPEHAAEERHGNHGPPSIRRRPAPPSCVG